MKPFDLTFTKKYKLIFIMRILANSIRKITQVSAQTKSELAKKERPDCSKRKAALGKFMKLFSQRALIEAIDGDTSLYMWDPEVNGVQDELEKIELVADSISWVDVMSNLEIGG